MVVVLAPSFSQQSAQDGHHCGGLEVVFFESEVDGVFVGQSDGAGGSGEEVLDLRGVGEFEDEVGFCSDDAFYGPFGCHDSELAEVEELGDLIGQGSEEVGHFVV